MRGTRSAAIRIVSMLAALAAWVVACVGSDPGPEGGGNDDGGANDGNVVGTQDAGGGGDADGATSDGGCGDTMTSATNCGSCGHACKQGFSCSSGKCGNEVVQIVTSMGFTPTGNNAQHVCAVLRSGDLHCWGDNSQGQLGVPSVTTFAQSAQHVTTTADGGVFGGVIQAAGAEGSTCTVTTGGKGFCWGDNAFGEYGNGTTTGAVNQPKPAIDAGTTVAFAKITSTLAAFCAIDGAGDLWCWGYNQEYELGHDNTTDLGSSSKYNPTPMKVVFPFPDGGAEKVIAVQGGPVHACALVSSGHVYCWGHNQWGNIGNDTSGANVPTPTLVHGPNGETTGLGGVVELATGSDYTCARTAAKTVYCWGYGGNGNLGNGASDNIQPRPVQVKGPNGSGVLAGVEAIGAGWFHACAVVTNGNVYCWGTNEKGELGIGTSDGSVRNTPTTMVKGATGGGTTLDGVVALSGGRASMCALRNDDTVWCWGENLKDSTHGGYLGNDDPNHADSPFPVQVKGLP